MQDTTIAMIQGDSAPARTFTFTRADNTVADLTEATSVDFFIYRPDTGVQTNTGKTVLQVLSPKTNGQATYTWNNNDLPVSGVYRSILSITYSDGTKESAKVIIDVESNA